LRKERFRKWHLLYLIPVILLVVGVIAGCTSGVDEVTDEAEPPVTKSWTVLIYMCAVNNLYHAAWNDMNKLEKVGSSDSMNIVVQFDQDPEYDFYYPTYDFGPKGCGRYIITRNPQNEYGTITSPQVEWLGDVNSGDPDTLVNFVKWGMKNYPANKYAIIIWDHGLGWRSKGARSSVLRSICDDEAYNDSISEYELRQAFSQIREHYGKKVELIGMDACLMGMLEVANDIQDSGKWFCASSTLMEMSPAGWPYDYFLEDLRQEPDMSGQDLARAMVTRYRQYYEAYGSLQEASFAGMSLDRTNNVISAVNEFAGEAVNKIDSEKDNLLEAQSSSQSMYNSELGMGCPDYIDLNDFMYQVTQNVTDTELINLAGDVMDAVENTVVYVYSGPSMATNNGGLSIWLPDATFYSAYIYSYEALPFAEDTEWPQFLEVLVAD